MYLTAYRKGDLIRMPDGEEFRLTSDGYEMKPGRIYCDTDRGKPIKYTTLMEKAYIVEDINGRKNVKY